MQFCEKTRTRSVSGNKSPTCVELQQQQSQVQVSHFPGARMNPNKQQT
jgi:hypothetical protein